MGPQDFGFRPLSLSALDHESICHPPPRPCFFYFLISPVNKRGGERFVMLSFYY